MCGIHGFVHSKRKATFNYPAFCTMGIANDSRGGDSCGVFIDKQVEYGVDDKKLFKDFMLSSKLLQDSLDTEVNIALGHCRKASVGNISETTAQPVVLRNKSNEVKFVMVHNGTIYNYKELAKKYIPKVNIDGLTDSQVMARIFYYKGYDVLSEYYGGSVFFIVDYRQPEPTAYIFKGASKKTNYSTVIEEERPLWLVVDEESGDLAFCSINPWLHALFPGYEVVTPRENSLLKFNSKGLSIVKDYPRDNVSQTMPAPVITNPYYAQGRYYGDWDDECNYDYGSVEAWKISSSRRNNKPSTPKYPSVSQVAAKKIDEANKSGGTTSYKPLVRIGTISYNKSMNTYLEGDSAPTMVNGQRYASIYGDVYDSQGAEQKDLWFYNGILLEPAHGKVYFGVLENIRKSLNLSAEDFIKKHENAIRYLSIDQIYPTSAGFVKATGLTTSAIFTGKLHIFGRYFAEKIENGLISASNLEEGGFRGCFVNDYRKKDISPSLISISELRKLCLGENQKD